MGSIDDYMFISMVFMVFISYRWLQVQTVVWAQVIQPNRERALCRTNTWLHK